jgi:plastocyanin
MNDRFRYRPDAITVRAGRRVTFSVTNAGKLPHEFTLGDRASQLDHERQMQLMPATGGHAHSHGPPSSLTVPPGETRRLSWTFREPGLVLYGCHVLGHWAAGMKGTIVVSPPTARCPADLAYRYWPEGSPGWPGRPGRARRRISSSWLRAVICWAKRVAWMPWKRPSSQPTSWAWATRSSASLGISSPTKGWATRLNSWARSGERLSDSSRTEMS